MAIGTVRIGATPCCGVISRSYECIQEGDQTWYKVWDAKIEEDPDFPPEFPIEKELLRSGVCPDCNQPFIGWLEEEEKAGKASKTEHGWRFDFNRAYQECMERGELYRDPPCVPVPVVEIKQHQSCQKETGVYTVFYHDFGCEVEVETFSRQELREELCHKGVFGSLVGNWWHPNPDVHETFMPTKKDGIPVGKCLVIGPDGKVIVPFPILEEVWEQRIGKDLQFGKDFFIECFEGLGVREDRRFIRMVWEKELSGDKVRQALRAFNVGVDGGYFRLGSKFINSQAEALDLLPGQRGYIIRTISKAIIGMVQRKWVVRYELP